MTRILITGVSGLLGLNLAMDACQNHQVTGVANTHSLAGAPFGLIHENLQNFNVIPVLLEQVCPDLVIHCAAQANLETCENDPAGAEQINALLPGELAYQAGKRGIRMVHISTDAVFDGQIPLPSSLAPIREGYFNHLQFSWGATETPVARHPNGHSRRGAANLVLCARLGQLAT
ncbi:MAG TPA: sugar nucleotide-binding protein, partial [Anaerolineaceae bacterium]|nr:sugar nucleotide-binding protein [Anaerolineaceae bacterium]